MVKSNNKGFSLVELIIAAAVFAILVYPITNALIAATKTTSTSTKKQYAVEKAEEIMENFKTLVIRLLFLMTTVRRHIPLIKVRQQKRVYHFQIQRLHHTQIHSIHVTISQLERIMRSIHVQ